MAVWLQMHLSKKQILDALPQPGLSRRRRLWRRRGGAPLFRQVGAQRDAGRGGDAGRHAEGAGELFAGHPPGRRRRRACRPCSPPCRTPATSPAAQASLAMSQPVTAVHDVAGGSGRYVADWVMDQLPQYVGGQIDQDIIVDTTIDLAMQAAAAKAISRDAGRGRRQIRRRPGGAGRHRPQRRGEGDGRRARLHDEPVQPGGRRPPPAGLGVQAVRLPDRAGRRHDPGIGAWSTSRCRSTAGSRRTIRASYKGPVTLRTALADSLNSVVGAARRRWSAPKAVAATARRLGIVSPLMATPSIALGTSEVTPLELTAAYVPFSNGGRGVIPYAIKRITTAKGKVLYERSGTGPGQVVDPTYVGMMNSMLSADGDRRHRHAGAHPRLAGGRQDRHQPGFPRRLVHRLHRRADRRRVVRQRRQQADQARHRRQPAGDRLAALHERGARRARRWPTCRATTASATRPTALCRAAALPLRHDPPAGRGAPMVLAPGSGNAGAVATGPNMPQGGWMDRPPGRPVPPGAVGQRRREGPITGFLQQLFGG